MGKETLGIKLIKTISKKIGQKQFDLFPHLLNFSDSTAKMRCRQRKQLFQRRNKVCDLSLILGLLGLILVVIDTELTAQKIVTKVSGIV